jgi:hypothetical protein
MTQRQANELYEGLKPHFLTVQRLDNPTTSSMRDHLRSFFTQEGAKEDGRLFIFYIGHGFTDPFNNNGFVTGSDTPAVVTTDTHAMDGSLSMQEYDALTRLAHARQVLTVFDSCFSGTILWQGLGNPPQLNSVDQDRIRGWLREPVRYYITAGDYQEEVPADLDFAQILLDGINGEAAGLDGAFVTGERLGTWLKEAIPRAAGRVINPQFGAVRDQRYSRGQFIFATNPQLGMAPPDGPTAKAIVECDTLAATMADQQRPSSIPGVRDEMIDVGRAWQPCQAAASARDLARFGAVTTARIHFELGNLLYKKQLYPDAAKHLEIAVGQGYAIAQDLLGVFYTQGWGVTKSYSEAARLFHLAADQGNAQGQADLGVLYLQGLGAPQSNAEAIRYFQASTEQANRSGQYELGIQYSFGDAGLPQSDTEASRLVSLSANQGHPLAQNLLGSWYETGGSGLAKSLDEAIHWYQLAARVGNKDAQKNLRRLGKYW